MRCPRRTSTGIASRWLPFLVPAGLISALVVQIVIITVLEIPGNDEAELLHVSYMMAHGARLWVDIFEHHSPLYLWLNARLFDSDAVFYVLYAKIFHLLVYFAGACLFAAACYLWLGVDRALKWHFLLLAVLVYLPLTQPVDFAVARPEGYAFACLFGGSIIGLRARNGGFPAMRWFASGFFLGLAVALSPRALPLSGVVGLALLWRTHGLGGRAKMITAFAAAGILILLINVAIAPAYGFYLWLIDFNGHLHPYRRDLPFAAYAAIGVAQISLMATGGLLALVTAKKRRNRLAEHLAADIGPDLIGMLFVGQAVLVMVWCYLFADHSWGRQGVGGIVVVSAFYICLLVAVAFRLYGKWLAPWVTWIDRSCKQPSQHPARSLWGRPRPRARQLGPAYWGRFAAAMIALLAIAAGIKRLSDSWGRSRIGEFPPWLQPIINAILEVPPILRGNLASYPWWAGLFLLPAAIVLVFLILRSLHVLPRWRRGQVAAITIRAQYILLCVAMSELLVSVPQKFWAHAPSGSAAAAFSAAMAAGEVWPRTRKLLWPIALLVGASQIAMISYSPGAVAAGAFAGILIALLLRNWFAARQFVFAVDTRGHVAHLSGPSWRRISALPQPLPPPAPKAENAGPALARKILAALTLAPFAIGLLWILNTKYTITDEMLFQHMGGYFQNLKLAAGEKNFRLSSIDSLPPMTDSRNLAQWMLWSRRYCEIFRGEEVGLIPTYHPPCLKDASFYWYIGYYIMIMHRDGVSFTPKPDFHLGSDLRARRPALLDATFVDGDVEPGALDALLKQDYLPVKDATGTVWAFVRRDWVSHHISGSN